MRSLYTYIQDIMWWCEVVCVWNLCALYLLLWPLYLVKGLLLTQYDESFDKGREIWEEQQIFVDGAENSCQYCCSIVLVALLNCNRVPAHGGQSGGQIGYKCTDKTQLSPQGCAGRPNLYLSTFSCALSLLWSWCNFWMSMHFLLAWRSAAKCITISTLSTVLTCNQVPKDILWWIASASYKMQTVW